jgi:hypothetical protein
MMKRQTLELVRESYCAGLTRGWLNAFVWRHLDALQICRCLPQEDTILTVPREHLEAHIEHMKSVWQESSANSPSIYTRSGRPIERIGSPEKLLLLASIAR